MSRIATFTSTLLAILVILGLAACASAPPTPLEPSTELPRSLHYHRNSAEYQAIMRQTYRWAETHLEQLVADRKPGSWAVALDIDETLLDNSEYDRRIIQDQIPYQEGAFDDWCRESKAPSLPGARQFLDRIHQLGGVIALVSNRRIATLEATQLNLDREDLPYDIVLLKDQDREKEPRWRQVREGTSGYPVGPVEIVMWVGDNIKDFPNLDQSLRFEPDSAYGLFGERYFVVPNPVYGSWKNNPQD